MNTIFKSNKFVLNFLLKDKITRNFVPNNSFLGSFKALIMVVMAKQDFVSGSYMFVCFLNAWAKWYHYPIQSKNLKAKYFLSACDNFQWCIIISCIICTNDAINILLVLSSTHEWFSTDWLNAITTTTTTTTTIGRRIIVKQQTATIRHSANALTTTRISVAYRLKE